MAEKLKGEERIKEIKEEQRIRNEKRDIEKSKFPTPASIKARIEKSKQDRADRKAAAIESSRIKGIIAIAIYDVEYTCSKCKSIEKTKIKGGEVNKSVTCELCKSETIIGRILR